MKLGNFLVVMATLSGCASITHEANQRVLVTTPGAPKAECTITSKSVFERRLITPEAIVLPRSSEPIEVYCHKKCFLDARKSYVPIVNAEDLASNAFIGGPAPLAIDLVTGKAHNYPYDFELPMRPDNRCRVKEQGFLDGDAKDSDYAINDFSFDNSQSTQMKPSILQSKQ